MNGTVDESNGGMDVKWLAWAWVLPQLLLAALNWHAWVLMRGDMSPFQHTRALQLGLYEAVVLAAGFLAWFLLRSRSRSIGVGLALAAIAGHTGYLWWFLQSLDRLIPRTVGLWMLPETELVFYQFSLMMPAVFIMLVRLARIRLRISTPADVGLSFAALVVIPGAAFIFGSMLVRLERQTSWHDSLQYMLLGAMVAATAFILIAFLRLLIRLHDLICRQSWSEWALPLAAGILAPLAGLALNSTIPFPYDFQDWTVYALAVLNGLALLIPFRANSRWAYPGWAARVVFYPFSLYFFLVFLPFLPLSLLAMIAAGAGVLILAPVFLFVIHSRRLLEQGRELAAQRGAGRVIAAFAGFVLVLPALILGRNGLDRRTLNRAVDAVYSPDLAASRVAVNPFALERALARMADLKHGIYLPYLSDLYDTMVFHGMVLPDEKADLIRRSLLGTQKPKSRENDLWGNGFLGGRRRPGERRASGAGVSHGVTVASHEESRKTARGMTECEIRFVLHNDASANGEYSERITVPEGVLVTGFWLEVNGTNKPAQIRERKAATWIYEMIRDMTRRDPGLVVFEGDRHLRLKVFPFSPNENRRCGMTFRFSETLQPAIQLGNLNIPLTGSADGLPALSAVQVKLPGQGTALAVPASVLATWPSYRREVVAQLVLDRSETAGTSQAALIERARQALKALPASITRVRLSWANYEQDDRPGEPLSREEADRALEQEPGLPARGGFCAEQAIMRLLVRDSQPAGTDRPSGEVPLYVVIPAPGSEPIPSTGLAPFARLAPDLPAYAVYDQHGLTRKPFDSSVAGGSFSPEKVVAVRNGKTVTLVTPVQESLFFSAGGAVGTWEVWNPESSRFETIAPPVACGDAAYAAGLSLWARHRDLMKTPNRIDEALPDLVAGARAAGVLVPETAFIVLETQSQEVMLARKEKQSLGANNALEFDELANKSKNAPAPPAVFLAIPALWLLWRRRNRFLSAA